MLVIDDAQHADEGLLAFVEYLLAAATFPCFVVLLTRPGLSRHPCWRPTAGRPCAPADAGRRDMSGCS